MTLVCGCVGKTSHSGDLPPTFGRFIVVDGEAFWFHDVNLGYGMHYPFLTFVSDCHNVLLLGMKKKLELRFLLGIMWVV